MTNEAQISEREREILELVATGATNQQIALQLNISVNTVKVHLRNIFGKIGVMSRTEATAYALRNGLVPLHTHSAASPGANEELLVEVAQSGLSHEAATAAEADTPLFTEPATHQLTSEQGPTSEALCLATDSITPKPDEPLFQTGSVTSAPYEHRHPEQAQRSHWWLWLLGLLSLVLLSAIALLLLREPTASVSAPDASIASPNLPSHSSHARWIVRSPLPQPRNHFAVAAFDLQQEIYVFGGSDHNGVSASVDRYDPVNDLWVAIGEMPNPVEHVQAATLRGKIYLPGGEDAAGNVRDTLAVYDPRGRSWSSGPTLPEPRSRYSLVAWDGQIYLIGGWDGQQICDEVFIFDPEANNWSIGPALPAPRQHAGVAIVSGRLYLIGGQGVSGLLREAVRLEPGTDRGRNWNNIAPLPHAMSNPAVIAQMGKPIIFDPIERKGFDYNQASDAWQALAIANEASFSSAVITLETGTFFIADIDASEPGAVVQYQPLFTVFLP